jgi:uncharacterized RDD family membrane protein YckC
MELDEEARKMMDSRIAKILKGIDVPDNDRAEIKKELISNYEDASMMKAQDRGSSRVEKADMAAALEYSEEPQEIASAYMASFVSSLPRAGIVSRSAAFTIDTIIITLITWIISIPFILPGYIQSPPHPGPPPSLFVAIFFQFFNILMISNLAIVFIYFAICEGYLGYTPGKRLLGLKVLNTDGKKSGYKETMLRSIPKLASIGILADAALMLLYRREDRQRIFDRIAGTIVIRVNK